MTVSAPAIMRPSLQTEIFPIGPARVESLAVKTGDKVRKGDRLISLSSDILDFERTQSLQRLALLEARLNRQASNIEERQRGAVLRDEIASEEMTLRSIEDALAQLIIYAPHNGKVSDIPVTLHAGRYISGEQRLMRIVQLDTQELLALPKEEEALRLTQTAKFTFISDDATAPKITGHLSSLAPTSEAVIQEKMLTSIVGGPIAVNKNKDGHLIANTPVFKVRGTPHIEANLARAERGIVKIKASPQSPAQALWRSVMRVLIRETDF